MDLSYYADRQTLEIVEAFDGNLADAEAATA